jgi:hypothetical protein
MRTTLTLDDDVYQAAQHLASTSGQRPGKVLSAMARRGLRQEPRLRPRRGLPHCSVPADAPLIPAARVQKQLDDEGVF